MTWYEHAHGEESNSIKESPVKCVSLSSHPAQSLLASLHREKHTALTCKHIRSHYRDFYVITSSLLIVYKYFFLMNIRTIILLGLFFEEVNRERPESNWGWKKQPDLDGITREDFSKKVTSMVSQWLRLLSSQCRQSRFDLWSGN